MNIIWIPYVIFSIPWDAVRHIARMEAKQKRLTTPITSGFVNRFFF
jgi:hypothetical protein